MMVSIDILYKIQFAISLETPWNKDGDNKDNF